GNLRACAVPVPYPDAGGGDCASEPDGAWQHGGHFHAGRAGRTRVSRWRRGGRGRRGRSPGATPPPFSLSRVGGGGARAPSPSQGGRGRSTATSMCMGPMVSSSIRGRRCSSRGGEDTGSGPRGGAGAPPLCRDIRLSPDEDGLNIDELLNAIGGEFATIATLFD